MVSDASPLINLARIGSLDLLRQLYSRIALPEAVRLEVVVVGAGRPGSSEVEAADWIDLCVVHNIQLVQALQEDLDAGEAEAIALAVESGADLLLMDEHRGRETARHLGLRPFGLVGVLAEAKHAGLLSSVRLALDRLRDVAGFRVHPALYDRVLQDEGEA